jgi:hypothetical protein
VGLGQNSKPDLWLHPDETQGVQTHAAVAAGDGRAVDALHATALLAGGQDTGSPRVRPEYHPSYYGAFVADWKLGITASATSVRTHSAQRRARPGAARWAELEPVPARPGGGDDRV